MRVRWKTRLLPVGTWRWMRRVARMVIVGVFDTVDDDVHRIEKLSQNVRW